MFEAADKQRLIAALSECPDGIVVLDYTLFDLKGVEECIVLQKRFPGSRWIFFSSELSEDLLRRLGAEPRAGLLLKECSAEEIISALRCTAAGERFVCHQIANFLLAARPLGQNRAPLTPTETEILKLIARGRSAKEIAAERCLSTHTVITHKKNIFRKLEVNNVYEATKYAVRAGLVDLVEYYI